MFDIFPNQMLLTGAPQNQLQKTGDIMQAGSYK
jgi:hypothetical protein